MVRIVFFALFLTSIALKAQATPLVVLIPGSGSSGSKIFIKNFGGVLKVLKSDQYFEEFQQQLKSRGIGSLVCPATEDQDARTLEERAEECARMIQKQNHLRRQIILVGHSMGGLIARLLAQDSRVKDSIYSVTTISTPHRGSPIADFAIDHQQEGSVDFYGRVAQWIAFTPQNLHYLPELRVDRRGTPVEFFAAQDIADNPQVQYFSFTSSMHFIPNPTLEISRRIVAKELRQRHLNGSPYGDRNDGIVPEYSMVHGHNLGHLEVYHWASACVDPVKKTKHCQLTLSKVMPHLWAQYLKASQ